MRLISLSTFLIGCSLFEQVLSQNSCPENPATGERCRMCTNSQEDKENYNYSWITDCKLMVRNEKVAMNHLMAQIYFRLINVSNQTLSNQINTSRLALPVPFKLKGVKNHVLLVVRLEMTNQMYALK